MKYYLNIVGGLGDIFCMLQNKGSTLCDARELLSRDPDADIVLNVYSDNPGSSELFKYSVFSEVNTFKHSEFPPLPDTNIPHFPTLFPEDRPTGLSLVRLDTGHQEDRLALSFIHGTNKICIFHPFTSTPTKLMPPSIDKQKFVDVMIDKYGYKVIMPFQTTTVYFGLPKSFDTAEEFDYSRKGLIKLSDYLDNITRVAFYLTVCYARKIIAVDSAYIMLRNWVLMPDQQNTLALLWEGAEERFKQGHYFYKGLDTPPNMYITYNKIADVEKLLDKFMEM